MKRREELGGQVSGRQIERLVDEVIRSAKIIVADPPRRRPGRVLPNLCSLPATPAKVATHPLPLKAAHPAGKRG
ncbi:MAG: hypothetical protein ABSD31_13620 [Candidatus Binataceae bacterium]|jgi:hypothetical protein